MKYLAWIAAIIFLMTGTAAFGSDGAPNLTGNWILNEKLSDDFAKVMPPPPEGGQGGPENGGGGRGGGGRGGGGGGRGGGGQGGQGGQGGEDRQARNEERLEQARKGFARLEIYHEDLELNVTDGRDITRLLYTDGREMSIWTERGEARATANWQDRALVVEWKTSQDEVDRIRRYTLAEDDSRLTVTEKITPPGRDEAVEMTLVYDLKN